jgi:hypothetical protein
VEYFDARGIKDVSRRAVVGNVRQFQQLANVCRGWRSALCDTEHTDIAWQFCGFMMLLINAHEEDKRPDSELLKFRRNVSQGFKEAGNRCSLMFLMRKYYCLRIANTPLYELVYVDLDAELSGVRR